MAVGAWSARPRPSLVPAESSLALRRPRRDGDSLAASHSLRWMDSRRRNPDSRSEVGRCPTGCEGGSDLVGWALSHRAAPGRTMIDAWAADGRSRPTHLRRRRLGHLLSHRPALSRRGIAEWPLASHSQRATTRARALDGQETRENVCKGDEMSVGMLEVGKRASRGAATRSLSLAEQRTL
jgi:hypothetical protein